MAKLAWWRRIQRKSISSTGIVCLFFMGFYFLQMFSLMSHVHHHEPQRVMEMTATAGENILRTEITKVATLFVNVTTPSVSYNLCIPASGQLGNLLFQYASLLGIARRNNRQPYFPPDARMSQTFSGLSYLRAIECKTYPIVYEDHYATYDPKFEKLPETNVLLLQYFQSWKYFDFIKDEVRKEFTFVDSVNDTAARLLQQCTRDHQGKIKVGVHVRRGDREFLLTRGYPMAPLEYILQAMTYMRDRHKNVVFVIVSDSVHWCQSNFNHTDVVLAPSASPSVHLAMLAACDHVIMTVGTFGWWGGYLSGGDVVYYVAFDPKLRNATLIDITHPDDHYPPHWIPIRL